MIKKLSKLSDKEKDLFVFFGLSDLVDLPFIEATTLYKFAMEHAFLNNTQGPYVDSLRRCIVALNTCSCYRLTKEWDDMIQCGKWK